jgi:drug/metabolite transporter (DMT)-like permease
MSSRYLAMLLLLAAIWGSSFMFIKVAVEHLTPADVVFGRVLVGTLALVPAIPVVVGWRSLLAELRRFARPFVLLALANIIVPFWFLAWSEKRLDSGLAAVLQPSMPLFTALLAFMFNRAQGVGGARLAGVVVGFVGVVLLVGTQPRGDVLSALAVLLTAFCYAGSALYAGARLKDASPIAISFGTLVVATIVSLPLGVAQLPAATPSWKVIGSVVALGALGLSLAYLLYYALITRAGASYAALVTYLVPALALGYGAAFLGEGVTAAALAGLALILVGVALGTGTVRLRSRAPAPTTL